MPPADPDISICFLLRQHLIRCFIATIWEQPVVVAQLLYECLSDSMCASVCFWLFTGTPALWRIVRCEKAGLKDKAEPKGKAAAASVENDGEALSYFCHAPGSLTRRAVHAICDLWVRKTRGRRFEVRPWLHDWAFGPLMDCVRHVLLALKWSVPFYLYNVLRGRASC